MVFWGETIVYCKKKLGIFTMDLRNLAIIAHVDHGKTTLVDAMLRQSGEAGGKALNSQRVMDSNDLEKERGITILAKCTSVMWKGMCLNIVDTPGHADFGGEVERILSMVDGVLLLVDAAEGVMPQTKFVLAKALGVGLKPLVVINKVDKPDARVEDVHLEVLDLFYLLDASKDQLDFPVLYASSKQGWAVHDIEDTPCNLVPLFESIVSHVPPPHPGDVGQPFQMLVTLSMSDPYLGRLLIGRITQGCLEQGQAIHALSCEGDVVEQGRVNKILYFHGIERASLEKAGPGRIVAVAGLGNAGVGHTLCGIEGKTPLKSLPIDPPTISMVFFVNTSPFSGREGNLLTSRVIRDRLLKAAADNVALEVQESHDKDAFEVFGRGELQLGILIETMRREGFELLIAKPRVLFKGTGKDLEEPLEELHIDVDEDYTGTVMEKLGLRRGEVQDMRSLKGGKTRLIFIVPSRGIIGYQGEFLTDTKGTGVMSRVFAGYGPFRGGIPGRKNGVLISNGAGKASDYALYSLQERGTLFIGGGDMVYEGMIIGEHNRENDLEVNPLKSKQLTNFRAAGKDESLRLKVPRVLSLEQAMTYIAEDERLEVTPKSIRMRKTYLTGNERKKNTPKKP